MLFRSCTKKEEKKGTTLYFSVFDWPAGGKLDIPGISNKLVSAKMLADGMKLKASVSKNGVLSVSLPPIAPDPSASVIKVEVKGKINAHIIAE